MILNIHCKVKKPVGAKSRNILPICGFNAPYRLSFCFRLFPFLVSLGAFGFCILLQSGRVALLAPRAETFTVHISASYVNGVFWVIS